MHEAPCVQWHLDVWLQPVHAHCQNALTHFNVTVTSGHSDTDMGESSLATGAQPDALSLLGVHLCALHAMIVNCALIMLRPKILYYISHILYNT